MGEKSVYRSALRSKRIIRETTLALMKEKDPAKITVTDIVKRADINRTTFYAHYPDVRGVLEEFENESIDHLMEILSEFQYQEFFQNPAPLLLMINRFLEEDLEFYRTLILSSLSNPFLEKLKDICIQYMRSTTAVPKRVRGSVMFEMRVCFFADGIIGMYKRWFKGEMHGSLNDITMEVSKIIANSAKDLLVAGQV